jgi:hypothetical protein
MAVGAPPRTLDLLAAVADAESRGTCVCGAQVSELQIARGEREPSDAPRGCGISVGPVEVIAHTEPIDLEVIVEGPSGDRPLPGPGRACVDGGVGAADEIEIGVVRACRCGRPDPFTLAPDSFALSIENMKPLVTSAKVSVAPVKVPLASKFAVN